MSSIAAARIALLLCGMTAVSACQRANGGSTTSTSANTLSPSEQQAGWKLLFDGSDQPLRVRPFCEHFPGLGHEGKIIEILVSVEVPEPPHALGLAEVLIPECRSMFH